ncbi:MAG: trypsin-like peptidase domain-containing protein, partial [Pseudomonadota bacterium]|nr:trypsin-like peptidase domain-containing protein [Pseudomonadota bacterium]
MKELTVSYVIFNKSATMVGALSLVGIIGFSISGLPSSNLAASTIKAAPVSIVLNRDVPSSFSKTIEKVGPAVVSIRVTSREPEMAAQMPVMPEPFARFFGKNFGFQFGNPGQRAPRAAPQTQGIGSGFFIDADGYVVTNEHVIRNAETIKITLKDGQTFEAKLVGKDLKTDLALLKVEADRPLPFVRFGKSSKVMVGDWVIALGSPFGLGHTATTGIVSATGRDIGAGPYDDYLQIDASINRGNSGGPTFNTLGEVVGVNTAIISPTGVSAGIGFAIPSDMAKSVIAQLQSNGSVS